MRYIAAYLLLQLSSVSNPSAADIARVLHSVGVEVDSGRLQWLLSSMEGRGVAQLIEEGSSRLTALPVSSAMSSMPDMQMSVSGIPHKETGVEGSIVFGLYDW